MPAPGDQHEIVVNPFDDTKARVSEYTAQEIATLQSRLEKQLGPEYLSERSGPGGAKVHYITAEKCIALANEVFGFNGWSSSIKVITMDFCDEHPQTLKVSLGLSVIVRVTLRDGTFHEDIGYGHIENCSGKAKAFEKAKKEGTTDALKRALRNFGNVLGNCIYDKDYVKKVTKMKVQPNRMWNENGLHRHADYARKEEVKVNVEPAAVHVNGGSSADASMIDSFDDLLGFDLDEVDFNIVDEDIHPDEVVMPQIEKPTPHNKNYTNASKPVPKQMQPPQGRPLARSHSAGNPPRPPQTPANQQHHKPGPQNYQNQAASRPPQMYQGRPNGASNNANNRNGPHQTPPPARVAGQNAAAGNLETAGFFSARAVKQMIGAKEEEVQNFPAAPMGAQAFNAHAESPSIRRTPGIDHSTSKPIGADGKHAPPLIRPEDDNNDAASTTTNANGPKGGTGNLTGQQQQQQGPMASQRGNSFSNPQFSQARRIGAPTGPSSPLANRGQYRPLTVKRPALTEVSTNGTVNGAAGGGGGGGADATHGDLKRQKLA